MSRRQRRTQRTKDLQLARRLLPVWGDGTLIEFADPTTGKAAVLHRFVFDVLGVRPVIGCLWRHRVGFARRTGINHRDLRREISVLAARLPPPCLDLGVSNA